MLVFSDWGNSENNQYDKDEDNDNDYKMKLKKILKTKKTTILKRFTRNKQKDNCDSEMSDKEMNNKENKNIKRQKRLSMNGRKRRKSKNKNKKKKKKHKDQSFSSGLSGQIADDEQTDN